MADNRLLVLAGVLIVGVLVVTGLWVPVLSAFQSPFYLSAPTSVEPGEQFQIDVSSVNYPDSTSTWTNDPCYGSGIDTGDDPSLFFYEGDNLLPSGIFDIQEISGWNFVGGAVGYQNTYTLQADVLSTFSGDVRVEARISCQDGSTDTQSTTVTLQSSSTDDGTTDDGSDDTTDGDDGTTESFNLETTRPADVSVSNGQVVGTVALENTGAAMQSNAIVEMQVRPEGASPLSFVGGQQACDPGFPENVHKEFRLGSGESRTIELVSEPEPDRRYDIYMLTQEGCFDEAESGPLDPYNNGIRVASDVCVGTCDDERDGFPVIPVVITTIIVVGLAVLGVRRVYG